MVLDSIIAPLKAEQHPAQMFFFVFIAVSICVFLSLWVFPAFASFGLITFTVMATLPFMVRLMQLEKERAQRTNKPSLSQHRSAILLFGFLFFGLIAAYTFWFIALPNDAASNLSGLQIKTLTEVNAPTGAVVSGDYFGQILFNNLRVLFIAVLFSLVFASGAIFILAWNASVISLAIANSVKLSLAATGVGAGTYFSALAFGSARYLVHGIVQPTFHLLGHIDLQ